VTELRRVDESDGRVLEVVRMRDELLTSGIEADGEGRLWCGDSASGRVRAVRRA
jgi:hypothetical protein